MCCEPRVSSAAKERRKVSDDMSSGDLGRKKLFVKWQRG